MEILVIIVIAVLILGVAVGPLLAMRSPAEADKLTPGADPASRSARNRTPAKHHRVAHARHTEDQPQDAPPAQTMGHAATTCSRKEGRLRALAFPAVGLTGRARGARPVVMPWVQPFHALGAR